DRADLGVGPAIRANTVLEDAGADFFLEERLVGRVHVTGLEAGLFALACCGQRSNGFLLEVASRFETNDLVRVADGLAESVAEERAQGVEQLGIALRRLERPLLL